MVIGLVVATFVTLGSIFGGERNILLPTVAVAVLLFLLHRSRGHRGPSGPATAHSAEAPTTATPGVSLNKEAPGTYSGEAYDATNAMVQVLKGVGANADRATVLDAYKKVNYTGLTKQVVFQPNGEVQGDAVYIYQVTNGQRKVLGLTKDLIK